MPNHRHGLPYKVYEVFLSLSDLLTSRIFRRLDGPSIADQSGTLQNMRPPDSKGCLQSE